MESKIVVHIHTQNTHAHIQIHTHIYRDTQAFASLREIFIVASFEDIFLDDISLYIYIHIYIHAKDTYIHTRTHIHTRMDKYIRG